MKIHVEKYQDETQLVLEGELTIYSAHELKSQLLAHLAQPGEVELNLAKVSEIDSAGLQVLILAKREAGKFGSQLRLFGHSVAVLDLIELYNLASYFGDPLFISTAGNSVQRRGQSL